MGDEDEDKEQGEDDDEPELAGQAKQEAKQLDSITDFVDEKETSKVDVKEVEARLNDLRRMNEESDKKRIERERQLAAVKIKKEDLDLMCSEFPLCEGDILKRVLQEHGGDLVAAMRSVVRKFPTGC